MAVASALWVGFAVASGAFVAAGAGVAVGAGAGVITGARVGAVSSTSVSSSTGALEHPDAHRASMAASRAAFFLMKSFIGGVYL